MIKVFYFLLILTVLLFSFLYIFSNSPNSVGVSSQPFQNISSSKNKTEELKIVSWNIAWLYGSGSEGGSSYVHKDESFFKESLNKTYEFLSNIDADIILLQEVDFDSKKSAYIDQLAYLARKLNMNYAYANSWDHHYIPFPYLPLSNHFGKTSSGGAILSKFKIVSNEVELFKKPASNPWWYNLLYLFRYIQKTKIEVGDKLITLGNLHLEAFDIASREDQISIINEISDEFDVIGGDFNMIPSMSSKKSEFIGYEDDNYTGDKSFDLLLSKSSLKLVFDEDQYKANESNHFTFPSLSPDRRLDYFLIRKSFRVKSENVLKSMISDHRPIYLAIDL